MSNHNGLFIPPVIHHIIKYYKIILAVVAVIVLIMYSNNAFAAKMPTVINFTYLNNTKYDPDLTYWLYHNGRRIYFIYESGQTVNVDFKDGDVLYLGVNHKGQAGALQGVKYVLGAAVQEPYNVYQPVIQSVSLAPVPIGDIF